MIKREVTPNVFRRYQLPLGGGLYVFSDRTVYSHTKPDQRVAPLTRDEAARILRNARRADRSLFAQAYANLAAAGWTPNPALYHRPSEPLIARAKH